MALSEMHREYTEILGEYWEIRTGRLTVVASIWGVRKTALHIIIYKCNNFPLEYLPPPPKIYLTSNALPFIIRVKGDILW